MVSCLPPPMPKRFTTTPRRARSNAAPITAPIAAPIAAPILAPINAPLGGPTNAGIQGAGVAEAQPPRDLVAHLRARLSLMTREEVAETLGLSPKRVYELDVPRVPTSDESEGGLRWLPSDIADFIEKRRQAPVRSPRKSRRQRCPRSRQAVSHVPPHQSTRPSISRRKNAR